MRAPRNRLSATRIRHGSPIYVPDIADATKIYSVLDTGYTRVRA